MAGDEEMGADKAVQKARAAQMSLSYLNLADVVDPAVDDATCGFTNGVTFAARMQDGVEYTARIGGIAANANGGCPRAAEGRRGAPPFQNWRRRGQSPISGHSLRYHSYQLLLCRNSTPRHSSMTKERGCWSFSRMNLPLRR